VSAKDCVPVLRAAGLDGMASWAEARPVRMGGRGRTCQDLWDVAPRGEWLLRYARVVGAPELRAETFRARALNGKSGDAGALPANGARVPHNASG